MRLSSSTISRTIFLAAAVLCCAFASSARAFMKGSHAISRVDVQRTSDAGQPLVAETTSSDFTISVNPASPMVSDNEADATITLTGQSGFSGEVSLSCSVLPNVVEQPECFIFPNPVMVDSAEPASISMLGATTQPPVCEPSPVTGKIVNFPGDAGPLAKIGISFLVLMALACWAKLVPAGKRSRVLPATFIFVVALAISGCGAAPTNNSTCDGNFDIGTPPGTYIVTIVATSGSLTHMATVTVVAPPQQ
jgi:hypothetical protein